MTIPLGRRSFVSFLAGLVPGYRLFPFDNFTPKLGSTPHPQSEVKKSYICPPCGLSCDRLTFDKPGSCPNCGMTLIPAGGTADSPPTVAILLFNGAEIIDFAGPWEAFGTAGFLVHTVAEKLEPHTMVFGQKVMPDYTFDNSPKANVLLVPGGGYGEAIKNVQLIDWLKRKTRDVSYVMSVCTGAFLLARAGLLDGLTATTTYGMEEELAKESKNINVVYPRRFVDAGKIITTAGLSSGIDGALHLISRMAGSGAAQSDQVIAGARRERRRVQQQVRHHDDGVQRAAQIVLDDAHHPLAEICATFPPTVRMGGVKVGVGPAAATPVAKGGVVEPRPTMYAVTLLPGVAGFDSVIGTPLLV